MSRSVLRGVALILVAAAAIVALALLPKSSPKKSHPPNDDPWVLVNYDPDDPYGAYLSNGYISTRIKGDGVGSQDGEPLPCFVAGLYDDEKLIAAPTWSNLRLRGGVLCESSFVLDKEADYRQALDMRTGILTTSGTWRYEKRTLTGTIEVILSRARPSVALLRARLVPNSDGLVAADVSGGDPGERWIEGDCEKEPIVRDRDVWVNISKLKGKPLYLSIARGLVLGKRAPSLSDKSDPRRLDMLETKRGKSFEILSYVAVATGPDARSAQQKALRDIMEVVDNADRLIADHKAAWADLWKRGITVEGPRKEQQAIHSCMFYLLQSVREGSQWSIPPLGLSSNNPFCGHVFWDADTWMFPALLLQHPQLAKSIVDYRYNTLRGAMANAGTHGYAGAEYAWESGCTGIEDTPGGVVYANERHVNGDVALAQWQYYLATGDLGWLKTRGYPVIKATADYWVSRAELNESGDRYEILQVVPPDENANIVDNSVYTNAIAKLNLEIASQAAKLAGEKADQRWAEVARAMYIPFDAAKKRFIAFDDYRGLQAKQADTELLIYPLQFKMPGQSMTDIYRSTFAFYAPKVMPNGPAMTSSVHSVIAARLGDRARAYREFRKSYRPFLRGPFNLFNEKRSRTYDNTCFLTGAAGPIQAILYGIAGAEMDYFPADAAAAELRFSPCLPKEWKSVTIRGVRWRGKTCDITISRGDKLRVTENADRQ